MRTRNSVVYLDLSYYICKTVMKTYTSAGFVKTGLYYIVESTLNRKVLQRNNKQGGPADLLRGSGVGSALEQDWRIESRRKTRENLGRKNVGLTCDSLPQRTGMHGSSSVSPATGAAFSCLP